MTDLFYDCVQDGIFWLFPLPTNATTNIFRKKQLRKIALFKNVLDSFKLHPYMTNKTEYFLCMDLSSYLHMTRLCSNVYNAMAGGPNFVSPLSLHSYRRYSGACIGLEKWRGREVRDAGLEVYLKNPKKVSLFEGPDLFQELWTQEKLD